MKAFLKQGAYIYGGLAAAVVFFQWILPWLGAGVNHFYSGITINGKPFGDEAFTITVVVIIYYVAKSIFTKPARKDWDIPHHTNDM